MSLLRFFVCLTASLVLVPGIARSEEPPQEVDTVLPRFDPLSPEEAMRAFDVATGFRIELVAAEPDVIDPIAFAFDPAGRMLVVEMIDYSEREEDSVGRIRRLSDTGGDGRMDRSEVLVEGLSWPTAVESWPGGVIVGAPPHIYFYPVTDDEQGNATVGPQETWFSGFSRSNVQGMMNSFRWGNDLRLHGASSSNGGDITGITVEETIRLGRRDFAIDPRDRSFSLVPGAAQHGMDFDRWGNKFLTSNSDHLQQVLMVAPAEGRAERYSTVPPMRRSIAEDGPAADVYRNSPVEPWRLLRTHLRVTGQVPGVVEGGGRAAGYFTGATGVHIYEGDQWPGEEPIALVCDVGGNLVHRKRLDDDGLWKIGRRIDEQTEFVRSSDTWFRPVQLGGGPDGALYIADMYREVIEHPKSLPPVIKSQVDLNSGNDRGRIWRVVAEQTPLRREPAELDRMSSEELVGLLEHPNHWHRRTAARLLVHRSATETIDALRATATEAPSPEARLEALAVLEMISEEIDEKTLQAALSDSHPEVRSRGLEIAARNRHSLPGATAGRLAADDSLGVRFRLAYHSSVLVGDADERVSLLSEIAARDPADPWIRWAVEGSLGDSAIEFLEAGREKFADLSPGDRVAWYRAVVCQVLSGDDSAAAEQLVGYLDGSAADPPAAAAMTAAVVAQVEGVRPGGTAEPLAAWVREQVTPQLLAAAEAGDAALAGMADRMRLVAWASRDEATKLLDLVLRPTQPPAVQEAGIAALIGNDRKAASLVIDSLGGLTPATAAAALATLASRVEGSRALAEALVDGDVAAEMVPIEVKQTLAQSRDGKVRDAVADYLAKTALPPPGELYEQYVAALAQPGNALRGQAVFNRVCATCHAPEPGRERVGPELTTVADQPKEQILLSILDPNREVNPKYLRVQVVTHAGLVVSGIIADESDSAVMLVDSQGKAYSIPRGDIDELQTSSQSLMPEELAKEIDKEQMRDLITYLQSLRAGQAQP